MVWRHIPAAPTMARQATDLDAMLAAPDTAVVHEGLRRCGLTVHVSTKLNKSHTGTGKESLIRPTRGPDDHDNTPQARSPSRSRTPRAQSTCPPAICCGCG